MTMENDSNDPRRIDQAATQLEKMESLERLAGGIAHDFNNMLTAILGYTEMLLSDCPSNSPDRAALEEIQKAGLRAASLTEQLLAFSRKQVMTAREVDLNDTIAGLRTRLIRLTREDISLECNVADDAVVVTVDPAQIERAIVDLVLNARDALPGGGSIRVDVSRLAAADVNRPSHAAQVDHYVYVSVSDNGPAVAPEVRPHLFEPFFAMEGERKGAGLGLASVHGIVYQSQGWIDVASEPGRGTTFTMYFPATEKQPERRPQPAAVEPQTGRETVLIVEDEEAVRVIVSAVLRRQGYTVLETSSPLEACHMVDRHDGEIDLLVTDVVMPVMNGPALAQRLVAERPGLRVLFISGYAPTPSEIQHPNIAFLSKPFQTTVLAARVREILSRPEES